MTRHDHQDTGIQPQSSSVGVKLRWPGILGTFHSLVTSYDHQVTGTQPHSSPGGVKLRWPSVS